MELMFETPVTGDQKEESKEHAHCNKGKSNQRNGAMEPRK